MADQPKGIRTGDSIITEVTFFPPSGGSAPPGGNVVRANVDAVIMGQFVAKGFRILEGPEGLWIGMPADKDRKSGAYHDRVFPITSDAREHITEVMIAAFKKSPLSKAPPAAGAAQAPQGFRAWIISKLGGTVQSAPAQQPAAGWGMPSPAQSGTTSAWGGAPASAPAPESSGWGAAPAATPPPSSWGAPPPGAQSPVQPAGQPTGWGAPPAPAPMPAPDPAPSGWGAPPPSPPGGAPTWGAQPPSGSTPAGWGPPPSNPGSPISAPGFAGTLGAPAGELASKISDFRRRRPALFFSGIVGIGAQLVAVGMFSAGDSGQSSSDKPKRKVFTASSSPKSTTSSAARPTDAISWEDAANYEGQKVTLEGVVVDVTFDKKEVAYLHFSAEEGDVTAKIYKKQQPNFPDDLKATYKGKKVRVTGKVQRHFGNPTVVLFNEGQIEVVE